MRKVVYECDFCGTIGDKEDMQKLTVQSRSGKGVKTHSKTLGDVCEECVKHLERQATMDKRELRERTADMLAELFNPTGVELVERVGI